MCSRLSLPLLIGLLGCTSQRLAADDVWIPTTPPDLGPLVARVGEVPIFASQVLAEAKRSNRPLREALDDLVRLNLLAERARQAGHHPAAMSEVDVKSALVQRLLERELEPRLTAEAIPDQVLRPLYDKAKDSFVHPRLVDVAVLTIYTGSRMNDEVRRERAATAKDLVDWLRDHPPKTLDEFSAVGRDPAWTSRHVTYSRFLHRADGPLSTPFGSAIAALKREGETTRLLADDDGFYIARYVGERPPENVTFEQARAKIAERYLEYWRRQQFEEYTGRLIQAHKVVAFFERLNEQRP